MFISCKKIKNQSSHCARTPNLVSAATSSKAFELGDIKAFISDYFAEWLNLLTIFFLTVVLTTCHKIFPQRFKRYMYSVKVKSSQ